MVYDPACRAEAPLKKNPCPDCYHCQFCSDDRCNACRGGKYKQSVSSCRKLSVQEQIVLYDRINSQDIAE
ncbi:MAG: hypothetical protein GX422_01105 [Deltaproteobacteria bacterium]|nr:hypothetical protein [Deltaproteobacteria bacterium]